MKLAGSWPVPSMGTSIIIRPFRPRSSMFSMPQESDPGQNKVISKFSNRSISRELLKRSNWLVLIFLIFAVSAGFDYWRSANIEPVFKSVSIPDRLDPSKTVTKQFVSYQPSYYLLSILSSAGYALATSVFISVFFISTLESGRIRGEKEAIEWLGEEIREDIFGAVFKTVMPAEVFAAVKENIIANKLIRRNVKWLYRFSEENDKIVMRQKTSYEIHNLGHLLSESEVVITSQPDANSSQELISASCVTSRGEVVSRYCHENSMKSTGIEISTDCDRIQTTRVTVRVFPMDYAHVEIELKSVYDGFVQSACFTKLPIIDAELVAHFPKGYSFTVFSSFSSPLNETSSEDDMRSYTAKGGILPYQGYSYNLVRKNIANSTLDVAPAPFGHNQTTD